MKGNAVWVLQNLLPGFITLIILLFPRTIFRAIKRFLKFVFTNDISKKQFYLYPESAKKYGLSLKVSDGYINLTNPFRGIFIAGGAGSGKSESLIKPIILQAVNQNYCGILYDFKDPELSLYLYSAISAQKNRTVTAKRISFTDIASSARCNPLAPRYLKTLSHAEEYATVIINNLVPESITKVDFWNRSAIALLQSTIWFFKEHYPNECDLPHIVDFLQSSHHEVIKTLMKDDTCKRLISSIVTAYEQKAEGQLAGTISTLQLALNKINTPEIAYILGKDEVNLDINNPENPTFLAIGNNPTIQDSISPVISLIITVSLRMMNTANKHHSILILDEAPTLYIPKIENVPAIARSNKVSVVFCCQDLSQVVDKYGKGKKDILLSNLAYQFWGRVSHFETTQYMIQLAGKDDVWVASKSSSSSSSTNSNSSSESTSHSRQLRDNLKIQNIQNFSPGNFLCVLVERERRYLDKKYKRPHPIQFNNVFVGLFNPEYLEQPFSSFNPKFSPDVNAFVKRVRSEVETILANDLSLQTGITNNIRQAEQLNTELSSLPDIDSSIFPIEVTTDAAKRPKFISSLDFLFPFVSRQKENINIIPVIIKALTLARKRFELPTRGSPARCCYPEKCCSAYEKCRRVGENVHRVGGNIHRVWGNIHRVGENVHRVGGNIHRVGGNVHRVGENIHRVGGNIQSAPDK